MLKALPTPQPALHLPAGLLSRSLEKGSHDRSGALLLPAQHQRLYCRPSRDIVLPAAEAVVHRWCNLLRRMRKVSNESAEQWWALQDSNLRLPPCEGGTLPLS